jgi:hypothetical protein
MFDFLTAAEWELSRNWLGTAGGVIALLIGASTYRRNVKIKSGNKRASSTRN